MPMFEFYLDLKLSHGDDQIEGRVRVLEEIIPVLSGLKTTAQRSLYVRRLSEKVGIAESAVLAELEKSRSYRSRKGEKKDLRERLSASRATITDDLPLINLLIHYPHTMKWLMDHNLRILLSDPIIVEIFDAMVEIYQKKGAITPADTLERLEKEPAKERFREAMLTPPICRGDEVEQAVKEFEDRAHRIKMTESSIKARERGDIESLNQLLKLRRKREGRVL